MAKRSRIKDFLWRHAAGIAFFIMVVFVAFIGFVGYTYVVITKKFDSARRWDLPSRVYSDATPIVPGMSFPRALLEPKLNHVGYHVTVALDGETAIELAQQQRFDVIVMDLAMPKMDGVEATRRLKTDERTRQIPIIIVSGHAMQGLAGAARAAGAEGYCMKPCSPETLEREIERVLAGGSAPRPD